MFPAADAFAMNDHDSANSHANGSYRRVKALFVEIYVHHWEQEVE